VTNVSCTKTRNDETRTTTKKNKSKIQVMDIMDIKISLKSMMKNKNG
jgi:hypothetical protein